MSLEQEREAKIQAMLLLNDEILENLKEEFREYIRIIDDELERRKNR